jgi:glycine/D-amino acid oxidase-like deaminating enzyme
MSTGTAPRFRPGSGGTAIIVGAGVMGLCAAWALVRDGVKATIIDQGPIPNPASSSHDEHRIIRHAYGAMRGYARMIPSAFAAWDALWADLGQSHFAATHATYCLRLDSDWYDHVSAYLPDMGIGFRDIALDALPARLPMVSRAGLNRVVETDGAGILFAERIVTGLADWLTRNGATLIPNTKITALDFERGVARSDGKVFEADRLVCAAGAWTSQIAPDLKGAPVASMQTVAYLEPPAELAGAWAQAPVLLCRLDTPTGGIYVLPPRLGTRLKVGDYAHTMLGDPDAPRVPRPEHIANLLASAAQALDRFERYRVIEAKSCFYAVTADENFILRPCGARGWLLSACSGHGFKFAALMGQGVAAALGGRLNKTEIELWAAGKGGQDLPASRSTRA